jgi:hypothetical protein
MYENRKWIIINVEEVDKVDFSKILETSSNTLVYSRDGSKTFIKWEGENPDFISSLETKSQIYNWHEILEILQTSEWSSDIQ